MNAILYSWTYCPFCVRAVEILERNGIPYTEHVMDGEREALNEIKRQYGHPTVPIILLDGEFIGGCDELQELERRGRLD